ncbi:MAG: hypothetical protein ABI746_11740 [Dermatophilaceae bacterium]
MTGFLFVIAATGYILVGIAFEERDLIRNLADSYASYRSRVPALIPRPSLLRRRSSSGPNGQTANRRKPSKMSS